MVTRRDLLFILGAGGAWLTFVQRATLLASQVDPHFLRMYEDAQKQRPSTFTSVAIFAYHTDRTGLYNQPGQPGWGFRAGRAPTARADSSSTRSGRRPILIATPPRTFTCPRRARACRDKR